ncbi:MFS transporter [Acidilobus sp.]|uniref:MFS transporter n=1 Tax=Acidilobus sp. TaxID=1872109 RepID=UPI003D0759F2
MPGLSTKGSQQWLAFAALSIGMIVYGLAESYGPVSVASNVVPSSYSWLGYSLPYIFGGLGAIFAGITLDRLGRRKAFLLTSAILIVGLLLYVPVYFFNMDNLALLVASMALVGMAAIGLESPVLTTIAESYDPARRSKLLVLAPNFGNLGVALAFVPLLLFHGSAASTMNERLALMLMYIAPVAAFIIAWIGLSESLPWRAVKEGSLDLKSAWRAVDGGSAAPVVPTSGIGLRFATLLALGISQDVAFVYITYGITYAYFSSSQFAGMSVTTLVPLLGGFIMTVVGIIAAFAITPKAERRTFATLSFGLQLVMWIALAAMAYVYHLAFTLPLLIAFAATFIPVELTWAARALLEPELFPTNKRGLYVSAVRALVWILTGVITGVLTLPYVSNSFILGASIMTVMAFLGLGGAIIWRVFGFETANRSLVGLDLSHLAPITGSAPDPSSDTSKDRNVH